MAYQALNYGDQILLIDGQQIHGVQSVNASWSTPEQKMIAAGYGYVGSALQGNLIGEISVDRLIVESTDSITSLFDSSFAGSLSYNSKSFDFVKGYIQSYQTACSVGEFATNNFSIAAYGGAGNITSVSPNYSPISAKPAKASKIAISTSFSSNSAIQSYEIQFDLERTHRYRMGSMFVPDQADVKTPVEVRASFNMLISEYEAENIFAKICPVGGLENLNISVYHCSNNNDNKIREFNIQNASLNDFNSSSSIDGYMEASLSYVFDCSTMNQLNQIF